MPVVLVRRSSMDIRFSAVVVITLIVLLSVVTTLLLANCIFNLSCCKRRRRRQRRSRWRNSEPYTQQSNLPTIDEDVEPTESVRKGSVGSSAIRSPSLKPPPRLISKFAADEQHPTNMSTVSRPSAVSLPSPRTVLIRRETASPILMRAGRPFPLTLHPAVPMSPLAARSASYDHTYLQNRDQPNVKTIRSGLLSANNLVAPQPIRNFSADTAFITSPSFSVLSNRAVIAQEDHRPFANSPSPSMVFAPPAPPPSSHYSGTPPPKPLHENVLIFLEQRPPTPFRAQIQSNVQQSKPQMPQRTHMYDSRAPTPLVAPLQNPSQSDTSPPPPQFAPATPGGESNSTIRAPLPLQLPQTLEPSRFSWTEVQSQMSQGDTKFGTKGVHGREGVTGPSLPAISALNSKSLRTSTQKHSRHSLETSTSSTVRFRAIDSWVENQANRAQAQELRNFFADIPSTENEVDPLVNKEIGNRSRPYPTNNEQGRRRGNTTSGQLAVGGGATHSSLIASDSGADVTEVKEISQTPSPPGHRGSDEDLTSYGTAHSELRKISGASTAEPTQPNYSKPLSSVCIQSTYPSSTTSVDTVVKRTTTMSSFMVC